MRRGSAFFGADVRVLAIDGNMFIDQRCHLHSGVGHGRCHSHCPRQVVLPGFLEQRGKQLQVFGECGTFRLSQFLSFGRARHGLIRGQTFFQGNPAVFDGFFAFLFLFGFVGQHVP